MIGRRRIWLIALGVCILGVLGCVGCGVWLHGVAWRMERADAVDRDTPAGRQVLEEQRVILVGQVTALLGGSLFLILIALLALLGRRLGDSPPPQRTRNTDIWRRNVPPADDAEALERQWRTPEPEPPEEQ